MSGSPEMFDDNENAHERRALDSDRAPAATPLLELARGDGYRWAALDVTDLDPPTWFPPQVVN